MLPTIGGGGMNSAEIAMNGSLLFEENRRRDKCYRNFAIGSKINFTLLTLLLLLPFLYLSLIWICLDYFHSFLHFQINVFMLSS